MVDGLGLHRSLAWRWLRWGVSVLLLLLVSAGCWYGIANWNMLPNDEELIANFQAHRADFDELVRRYREYERPAGKDTSSEKGTEGLNFNQFISVRR